MTFSNSSWNYLLYRSPSPVYVTNGHGMCNSAFQPCHNQSSNSSSNGENCAGNESGFISFCNLVNLAFCSSWVLHMPFVRMQLLQRYCFTYSEMLCSRGRSWAARGRWSATYSATRLARSAALSSPTWSYYSTRNEVFWWLCSNLRG